MRAVLVTAAAALALAALTTSASAATGECRGITACIPVAGPGCSCPRTGGRRTSSSCPGGRSVVGGLDAQASSRSVRVSFDARLGAPVGPGVTTTRYALFRAVSTSGRAQTFQPRLGCIPVRGGGGRSTVSARVTPVGPALELRSRIVIIGPGQVRVREGGLPAERATRRCVARDGVPGQAAADSSERARSST